jgi:hypothetical protein
MEKYSLAFSVFPSPSVFATMADAHQEGHDQIHCCKSAFSNKVGDKESVNHTVNGCENHHYNRWKNKLQKFFISKMFG